MTIQALRLGRWSACVLAAALLVCAACDQEMPLLTDASIDTGSDLFVDTGTDPTVDTVVDTGTDTVTDPGTDDTGGDCVYPTGPYAFNAVGDTVGPMQWPSAVAGVDEVLAADLEALHCDPNVHSIFIQIVSTS